jgi:alkanesulfonate monooxygenase SsuD/methylene tetrahydromethanopterin reductase-like flavin-dependent oxidoreductase (luciferase family)
MVLPRSLDETRRSAELGESLGFSYISVADSPTVYQDSYLHQLEVARAAPSVKVGPMVSHVVIRHPIIVGNQLSTLNHFTGGRAIGTIATGNSAARGLGLKPAKLSELEEAVLAIQSYWRGEGGRFKDSEIPVSGLERDACPILISGDGPKAVELSGRVGDGLLYGGTIDREVSRRRLAACRAGGADRAAWVAPTVSLKTTHDEVSDDLGAMVVAMANRAMRGDLAERGVPPEIQEDVLEMRRAYDYGFHADSSRPRNTSVVSERLRNFLIDTLCVWGDEDRFKATLDGLAEDGWTGVMFILGQAEMLPVIQELGERLQALGYLKQPAAV